MKNEEFFIVKDKVSNVFLLLLGGAEFWTIGYIVPTPLMVWKILQILIIVVTVLYSILYITIIKPLLPRR